MAFDEHALGLSAALASLRADLTSAAEAGAGEKFAFRVDEVKLELTLVASSKVAAGVGAKWFVLSAEASGEVADVVTQKVTLTMGLEETKTRTKARVSRTTK